MYDVQSIVINEIICYWCSSYWTSVNIDLLYGNVYVSTLTFIIRCSHYIYVVHYISCIILRYYGKLLTASTFYINAHKLHKLHLCNIYNINKVNEYIEHINSLFIIIFF